MPTLLQINSVVNTGSTGRIAEEIGQTAIQNDWTSYIAYGRAARESQSNLIKIGTDWDIKSHGLQTRLFDRHGLGSRNATLKFIQQLEEIKPDIIHLHNIHGYYLNIEVLFKYLASSQTPVIWTFHDCWPITGHCSHFEFVECEKWKTECHHCPQKKEYPASYFIDRSRKNFKLKKDLFTSVPNMTIVPVSKWLNGHVRNSFMSHIPIQVIYNGIDLDIFTPDADQKKVKAKLNMGDGFMILGVAGVWPKQKGLSDFIKLSELIGATDFIVLVGLTKSQLKKLPPNIIGISHTETQVELKDLYATANVYVNPTLADSFPTTNLEALACGTPIVTYRTGGSPEAIDANTGIVVEKSDVNGLLNAIETVRKNGKDFYSTACRARAVNLFNKNDRFAEYIDLYESVLKDKKGRSLAEEALTSHPLNL